MYYDEETGRYYASQRDADKIKLWVRVHHGDLRPIEGFTRYTIFPDGSVYNIERARPVQPFLNNGRLAIGIVSDEGRQKTLGLARLIASHFVQRPTDEDQYYDVVHIDDDLMNVHPSNLQWVPRWKRHANPNNYDLDIS